MLSRDMRLTHKTEFDRVFRIGKCVSRSFAHIHACKTTENALSKLGVIAGKRVGKSVIRNLCKRRIRELFRHYLPLIGNGYDFVIVARNGMDKVAYADLLIEMERGLTSFGFVIDKGS